MIYLLIHSISASRMRERECCGLRLRIQQPRPAYAFAWLSASGGLASSRGSNRPVTLVTLLVTGPPEYKRPHSTHAVALGVARSGKRYRECTLGLCYELFIKSY